MPKKQMTTTDLEQTIMARIKAEEITMKPKWYFVVGSLAMFAGLVASSIGAVFLTNLVFFSLRQHGPRGEMRLELMLSSFPLWIPVLAIGGMIVGIWMLKKYDWSYKKNFWLVAIGFIVAIVLAGVAIDQMGLNEIWFNRGPMRGLYQRLGNGNGSQNFEKGYIDGFRGGRGHNR